MDPLRQSRRVGAALATLLAFAFAFAFAFAPAVPAAALPLRGADDPPIFRGDHGTRPAPLRRSEVAGIATAFGIDARPERTDAGWEAEDETRSLYLWRAPSAWYVQFEDASVLLQPAADRAAVCARATPPHACRDEGVQFVADTLADPPAAGDALDAARGLLEDAGLVDDRWNAFVTEPSIIPAPCRPDLVTSFDCNQQLLATRSVHLSLRVGPGTTELRWGVVVGPGPTVYVATGRAVARPE